MIFRKLAKNLFDVTVVFGEHLKCVHDDSRLPLDVASLAIHYVTAVVSAVDPALAANQSWHLGTLFISSTVSALFLGRAAVRLRVYLAATPVAA